MSNGVEELKEQENRVLRLSTKINMMALDRTRDPRKVADHLQLVVDDAERFAPDKFVLFADLGIITVPEGYVHGKRLATFKTTYQGGEMKSFYFYNDDITDGNFPNPTRVLKPGDKLWVRAFAQIVSGTTTSEERMGFIRSQKGIFTGAQGASLVWEQKRDSLPKGKWYAFFDEKDRLWEDAHGRHRVPDVDAYSDGVFIFDLGSFETVWNDRDALLVFCDLPAEQSFGA